MKDGFYIYVYRYNKTLAYRNLQPYTQAEAEAHYEEVSKDKSYGIVEFRSVFNNNMKTLRTMNRIESL